MDGQHSVREALAPGKDYWFDTSYSGSADAIGNFRFPRVINGRYEPKQPIFDSNNNKIGFLVKGARTLGHTYNCIYVDKAQCFYLSHVPFGSVKRDASYISIVSSVGRFLFSRKDLKFERTQSFVLPNQWVGIGILAFKLIEEQQYLFFLTQYGFCLIDTIDKRLVSKTLFDDISYAVSGFNLFPDGKLLAVGFSVDDYTDPSDGEQKHRNFINIYELVTGKLISQKSLETDYRMDWKIAFSIDGRRLTARSEIYKQTFDLEVAR